jgi:hypothetical protein
MDPAARIERTGGSAWQRSQCNGTKAEKHGEARTTHSEAPMLATRMTLGPPYCAEIANLRKLNLA